MSEAFLDTSTTIPVADHTFRSVVQEGALAHLPHYFEEEGLADGRVFIITDHNVQETYGDDLEDVLWNADFNTISLSMEPGEEHKTWEQAGDFVERLSAHDATRKDIVIALGGGVVGDLGGFVASVYNRGVRLVHVPTTILAMVDSSIGGKTGVDHGGKNKAGSFYQPSLVVADPAVLKTLDERVYTEGFGEVAKYAILDADFLPELETAAEGIRHYSDENLEVLGKIIARCVKQKSDIIAADPFEKEPNGRILLNYGHTLGHGLEAAGSYTELLHGEGVAIGMTYVAQLALRLDLAEQDFVDRQTDLLQALGLPIRYEGEATLNDIMGQMAKDKKATASDTIRFVLLQPRKDLAA